MGCAGSEAAACYKGARVRRPGAEDVSRATWILTIRSGNVMHSWAVGLAHIHSYGQLGDTTVKALSASQRGRGDGRQIQPKFDGLTPMGSMVGSCRAVDVHDVDLN